jgi:hypothetical protein
MTALRDAATAADNWQIGYGWGTAVLIPSGTKIKQTTDAPLAERQATARMIRALPPALAALEVARAILQQVGDDATAADIADVLAYAKGEIDALEPALPAAQRREAEHV